MKRGGRWIAGLLVVTGLVLPACRSVAEEEEEPMSAATLEQIQGTDLVRVILTQDAAEYVREPVVIDRIAGNRVFLTDGPAPGTEVVTQGAAELYGSETGVEE